MKDIYFFNWDNGRIYKRRKPDFWCVLDTEIMHWIPIIDPTGCHWFNPKEIAKSDIKELTE